MNGRKKVEPEEKEKRLLEAGVIEEPRRGELAFTLPGFREFLLNRDE